jgi:hypothetical protein
MRGNDSSWGMAYAAGMGILAFVIILQLSNKEQTIRGYEEILKTKARDVIGDPNATDPNDVYIELDGRRFYRSVDGRTIEDYFSGGMN